MANGTTRRVPRGSNTWSIVVAYVEYTFGLYGDEIAAMVAEPNLMTGDTNFVLEAHPHKISKRLLALAEQAGRIVDSPINLAIAAAAAPETTRLLKGMTEFIRNRARESGISAIRVGAKQVIEFHVGRNTDLREFRSHL